MNEIIIAIILGIVEGATEFLPVSSTGHLIVVAHWLGFTGQRAATFEVFIQLGAILAVVGLYRQRFKHLLLGGGAEGGLSGQHGLGLLALTTLPAVLVGAVAHGAIKQYLFNPVTVAIGLAVGAVAIIIIERRYKPTSASGVDQLTPKRALAIGLFQVLAMWPGVSRAGATIMGGMLQGLDRRAAVEYSFLAAVPVMIVAVGYDLLKSLPFLTPADAPIFLVGFVTAFVFAIIAIKFFVHVVQTNTLEPFAWYRIAFALVILTSGIAL